MKGQQQADGGVGGRDDNLIQARGERERETDAFGDEKERIKAGLIQHEQKRKEKQQPANSLNSRKC